MADLKRQGQFLGAGQNGGAYRLGERVLKVLHAPDDFLFNKPTRTARYWNEFHGADEETWLLVTARAVRLADGTPALDTPFIETAARKPYQPELRSIEKKLKQRGLKLHYVNVPGNVVVSRGGKAVLTDFDMARHIDADSAGGDEIKALRKGKLPPPWNPRWG
ncbi:MAG: hypothetical protein MO853_14000 [Candidatus Protistobacter heckmanni]|nr:hypothetical protein [Candidatus Protistobacter heckmanni]